jgi:hypothetical protein
MLNIGCVIFHISDHSSFVSHWMLTVSVEHLNLDVKSARVGIFRLAAYGLHESSHLTQLLLVRKRR